MREQQPQIAQRLAALHSRLPAATSPAVVGRVVRANAAGIEVAGIASFLAIGDRVTLGARDGTTRGEVIGFADGHARVLPLGPVTGIGPGSTARFLPFHAASGLSVSDAWLGRIVDPLGEPLDNKGALVAGPPRPVRADPPQAAARSRLGRRVPLGVRALDVFTTCRTGQRLGLFAGSGVGKSTLLAMIAKQAQCDVIVLGLVGERGREVREFVEDDLGPALARSVVVVATSDRPALLRREAAYAATAVAEHFRDQGKSVLLMMDSVTRFCHAMREIGLAAGEPPATRGYPPSAFAELPLLLERAGPGVGAGAITALYTVLVDGDDHDEPVADAVRGILDGHVLMSRAIAETGRYPAVDVSRSLSRTVPGCLDDTEAAAMRDARAVLARAATLADLVRLGAYSPGADPESDRALRLAPRIEALLMQRPGDAAEGIEEGFARLRLLLSEAD
jgi:flagellum-specific ATP synthase